MISMIVVISNPPFNRTNEHAKVNEDTLVTVDVAYAGVNYADVCIRWGLYSSAKKYNGYPITPGFEFSGTVQSVGSSVTQFKKGDNVFGVTMFGAYSTRVTVPECQLFTPSSASPFTQRESIAVCIKPIKKNAHSFGSYISTRSNKCTLSGFRALDHILYCSFSSS